MRKETVYSAASSIINLALVLAGVGLATVYVPRLIGHHAWWVYASVAVVSLPAFGYLVQWVLSAWVNTVLGWLILGRRAAKTDRLG